MPLLLLDTPSGQPKWLEEVHPTQTAMTLADWLEQANGTPPDDGAIQLTTADNPEALLSALTHLHRVEVLFDDINDGRGFSVGRRLREMGFAGEIRATGRFLQDQIHYLSRCGFTAFALPAGTPENIVLNQLKPFSIGYQAVLNESAPRILTTQSPPASAPAEAHRVR